MLIDRYGATNPKLFGSVARGTASAGSDIDILVGMDPAEGRLLMRASGLLEESRALFGRGWHRRVSCPVAQAPGIRFDARRGGAAVSRSPAKP
ncbi:nucleotidyltransferase family protein [Corynebacterium sp. c25Ua_47]|uniref:nucleotidyltransferase family protein n=1 Tax=Corynebacterium sp. c25Ua_47 TaxID=3032353 RepID=UPI0025FA9909|nr:nucleotidyltransferase domain-containing protein [uncultured Corynebacterium sp.]